MLIENASDDATPDILREYALNNGWQVISEPRRGKSFALNTGIEMASGQLIDFVDDDTLPDQGWLQAYLDTIRAPRGGYRSSTGATLTSATTVRMAALSIAAYVKSG